MSMDSYQIYSTIRDSLGYKDSYVAASVGITKSTFSDWKAGRYQPKADKLQLIANFLGVSLEYMMSGKIKESSKTNYIDDDIREIVQEIFASKELLHFLNEAKNAKPEDINTACFVLMALKRKEKGEI